MHKTSSDHPGGSRDGVRVRIDLAYLGTAYHGWQQQKNLRTVQGEMIPMLTRLLGREKVPVGAGRTDAGVHARGQVCHVNVADEAEAVRLQRALVHLTPPDMKILAVRRVSPDFDARFSALARRYSYHLQLCRDIFRQHISHLVSRPLDREAMDAAGTHFLGTRDFASFCKTSSRKEDSSMCAVDLCHFQWADESAIFHISANRFLHHMVRNVVGTLLEVGYRRRGSGEIPAILAARDRRRADGMAPAAGLFLEEVTYPAELLDPDYRRAAVAGGSAMGTEFEGETV